MKGDYEEANSNFLYSVQIDGSIGKNWFAWGSFLDKKLDRIMDVIKEYEKRENYQKDKIYSQYIEEFNTTLNNAFSAFLQSTIYLTGSKSRRSFLKLLKYFKYENECIKSVFTSQKDEIDVSRFFFFIPQLLVLLDSENYYCAQIILTKMIEKYPQSLFLHLRTAMDNTDFFKIANKTDQKSNEFGSTNTTNSFMMNNNENGNLMNINQGMSTINNSLNTNNISDPLSNPYNNNPYIGNPYGPQYANNYSNLCANSAFKINMNNPMNNFSFMKQNEQKNTNENTKNENNTNENSKESKKGYHYGQRIANLIGSLSHPSFKTFFSLDRVVGELVSKMSFSLEEDCYKMSNAIFNEAINKIFDETPISLSDLGMMIERLASAFERSQVHEKYKIEFRNDFYDKKNLNLFQIAKKALKWKTILENILQSFPVLINIGTIKTKNDYGRFNTSDIQVFGQYCDIKNIYDDFVTIEGFEPTYLCIWKNGNSIKKVTIRGNDGKKYPFIYSAPISDVYKREDRISQISEFMNSELDLQLSIKTYVNLNKNTRLIKVVEPYYFMDDILDNIEIKKGFRYDDLVIRYISYLMNDEANDENEANDANNEQGIDAPNESNNNESLKSDKNVDKKIVIKEKIYNFSKKKRLEAFKMMSMETGDNILVNTLKNIYKDTETYYLFKNRFLCDFAAKTPFLYIFAVGSRSPCRMAIGIETGRFYNVDVFPYLDNNFRYKTNEAVPLRLTANLQKYFGKEGIEGPFYRISYEVCKGLKENDCFKDLFIVCLSEEEGFGRENDILKQNFDLVMERIDRIMSDVNGLLNESSDPENLCMMNPLWHPWF